MRVESGNRRWRQSATLSRRHGHQGDERNADMVERIRQVGRETQRARRPYQRLIVTAKFC